MKIHSIWILCSVIAFCLAPAAHAGSFAQGVCDATEPALAAGLAVAYFNSKDHGLRDVARTSEAMLVSVGIAQALQTSVTVDTARDHRYSFPSKRAAVAFAAATSLSDVYPKQKWIAYSGAAVVGWSTVAVKGHLWTDVLAGAALGFGVGKWSVSSPDGILIGRLIKF